MNHLLLSRTVCVLAVTASALANAQTPVGTNEPVREITLEQPAPERLNRIGLSYRMGLNITVDFKKLGGFPAMSDPGPATGTTYDRTYDNNSYNRVDSSTNAGGMTWYWGYQNANQVQGNTIVMESSTSPNNAVSKDHQDDPQHGVEIVYSRELFRDAEDWRVGFEAALGWTHISVNDSRRLMNQVNRIIDTFTIPEGVVVPLAPYAGTYEGPGALIGSGPERDTTVISQAATIVGDRTLDADVFTLRLGPYLEVPIYKKLSFIFDGGLVLAVGVTDFHYRETVTIEDVGSVTRSSSGSQDDFLFGGYVGGTLSYALTERISIYSGVIYQAAGRSVTDSRIRNSEAMSKKQSVLDLGEALILSFGASYSF
jgi:hypothetical protein